MKTGLFIFILSMLSFSMRANHINDTTRTDSIYLRVDVQPSFPGGGEAFLKYLYRNIKYSAVMKRYQVQGNVIVQFVVEKDGSLTNIKAIKGPGGGSSEEAVRVMQVSPKWKPGTKDGKPVRVQFSAPVNFILKKEESREDDGGFKISGN